jgi:hypothetical protein
MRPHERTVAWTNQGLADAVEHLSRPLPGPMAALYRMRVPATGGLRLSVVARDGAGRITVSEPFGAAVVVAGWSARGQTRVFDLREGCRLSYRQAGEAVGLGALPLERAVRLLGGRLPLLPGDEIALGDDATVRAAGGDWSGELTLDRDPWRVVEVRSAGFTVELTDHTSSLPGRLRILGRDEEPVTMVLSSLKWEAPPQLSPLPDLPPCGVRQEG